MKKTLFVWLCLVQSAFANVSAEPFVIKDIKVEGLQRVSIGTVFNYFPLTIGDEANEESIKQAIKKLYAHGMFEDIALSKNNRILTIHIKERPTIDSVEFEGNKDIQSEQLLEAFKRLNLAPGKVLNALNLEKSSLELQQQYISKGRYGTKVINHLTQLERNRVALKVEIQEGVQALVKQIKFIGNDTIDDDELLDVMEMKPTSWWAIFSTADRFSQELLLGDSSRIQQHYLNNGYVNFKSISTNVALTADKESIVVSFHIEEGDKFSIGKISVTGTDKPEIQKSLQEAIIIKPNDTYSKRSLLRTKKHLETKLGDFGYALANVNVHIDTDDENPIVDVEFETEIGQMTYIREIRITGNTTTRDDVIRRELREYEGGRFSASEVRISTARIRRLGYFETVNVEVKPVDGTNNQVDIIYSVVEASTGSARLGITYSENNGVGFNIGLSHNNFLGTGKKFNLEFVSDDVNTNNRLSITNPYFTQDGISLEYGIFSSKHDTSSINAASYVKNETGLNATFGVPINEYDRIYMGGKYSKAEFTCGESYTDCINYGTAKTNLDTNNSYQLDLIEIYLTWSRDSRNNGIFPTSGTYQRAGLTKSIGDAKYQKLSYTHQYFWPIPNTSKSSIKLSTSLANGNGDSGQLPFFNRYFVGGIGSVRGYTGNSLTPENDSGRNIGGSFKSVFNLDIITPFILAPDTPSVRMSTFIDAGYAFTNRSDFSFNKLNSSYGITIYWRTPVAPFVFSFSEPIKSEDSSNEQNFQFQIGYGF